MLAERAFEVEKDVVQKGILRHSLPPCARIQRRKALSIGAASTTLSLVRHEDSEGRNALGPKFDQRGALDVFPMNRRRRVIRRIDPARGDGAQGSQKAQVARRLHAANQRDHGGTTPFDRAYAIDCPRCSFMCVIN